MGWQNFDWRLATSTTPVKILRWLLHLVMENESIFRPGFSNVLCPVCRVWLGGISLFTVTVLVSFASFRCASIPSMYPSGLVSSLSWGYGGDKVLIDICSFPGISPSINLHCTNPGHLYENHLRTLLAGRTNGSLTMDYWTMCVYKLLFPP